MPRPRTAHYILEEVLRLTYQQGRSQREVARACAMSQSGVSKILRRARNADLGWPLPDDLAEGGLEEELYGGPPEGRGSRKGAELDFAQIHKDLKGRSGATLRLLWSEYREARPSGYGYPHCCALYNQWRRSQEVVVR